jgi:hypothetical protein
MSAALEQESLAMRHVPPRTAWYVSPFHAAHYIIQSPSLDLSSASDAVVRVLKPTWSELTDALHCMVEELEGRHMATWQEYRDRVKFHEVGQALTYRPIEVYTALTVLKSLVATHLAEANVAGFTAQDWLLDGLLSSVDIATVSFARRRPPSTWAYVHATSTLVGPTVQSLDGRNWLRSSLRASSSSSTDIEFLRVAWLPYCSSQRRIKDALRVFRDGGNRSRAHIEYLQVQYEVGRGHPDGL